MGNVLWEGGGIIYQSWTSIRHYMFGFWKMNVSRSTVASAYGSDFTKDAMLNSSCMISCFAAGGYLSFEDTFN